jgi:hypothetical protein
MSSTIYSNKSQIYFNLYNPPFCGQILRIAIAGYEDKSSKSLPFPLSFLILPVILHRDIRSSINPHKNLHTWAIENHYKLQNFDTNISELIGVTKRSLMLLLQNKSIKIENNADLKVLNYRNPKSFSTSEPEMRDCYNKARSLGSWFGEMDDLVTIFSLLGVKP